mgnify:FL=1
MNNKNRTIWQAVCDDCLNTFAAWPHWNSEENIPDPEDWYESGECPVCGGFLDWEFGDPMSTHIRTGYTSKMLQEE